MNKEPKQYAEMIFKLTKDESPEMIERIISEYRTLIQKSGKDLVVEVRTISPLSDELKEKILAKVQASSGAVVKEIIDPSLIGGIIVTYRDVQFDFSLRGKLNILREKML